MKFEVTVTPRKNGRLVVIKADGVEIGSRHSPRPYRFALVVKGNQAHAIRYATESISYLNGKVSEYEAIARRDESAIRKAIDRFTSRASIERYIVDGSYAKWAGQYRQQVADTSARLAVLLSGPQPEYDVPVVASWHSRRDLVPTSMPHQTFVAIVEIPE